MRFPGSFIFDDLQSSKMAVHPWYRTQAVENAIFQRPINSFMRNDTMKHIKKILSYSIAGSLGLSVVASLQGCGQQSPQEGMRDSGYSQNQHYFMVIEQTGANPDTYKVAEKHPTDGPTRAILRQMDGSERFMSENELRKLAEQEAQKVEAGQSRLTQDSAGMSGGMSLGETIMAAAVGSLVGGMIANRLMGNRNFQRNSQRFGGGRPTSSLARAGNTAKRAPSSLNRKPQSRRGFFGGGSRSSRSFGGFGG